MRRIFLIVAMMVSALSASAQELSIKPMAGASLANLTEDDCEMKVGIAVGVEAEKMFTDQFGLSAGLIYAMQGAKGTEEGVTLEANLGYINIPLLANFHVTPELTLKAGLQPGINVSSTAKMKASGASVSADLDGIRSVDFSIPFGVSYEVSHIVFDARYNLGLTKVMKDTDAKNSVFLLTVGYKFGL